MTINSAGADPQGTMPDARDPEDRPVPPRRESIRDKMLDKTLADSFPNSDPPSSIPDPSEDSFGEDEAA